MSVNISGVPFNSAKPTLDGRIVGGNPANIEDHPHQVNLSIAVELNYFFHILKYKNIQS